MREQAPMKQALEKPNGRQLLTVAEAQERLGIKRSKCWQMIADGTLRSVKLGGARRIPSDAIDELIGQLER